MHNSQEMESKCPLTDEWIKKMWYIYIHTHTHKMEYYSAIKKKKNEIMSFAATQKDLEMIKLSEIIQTKANI